MNRIYPIVPSSPIRPIVDRVELRLPMPPSTNNLFVNLIHYQSRRPSLSATAVCKAKRRSRADSDGYSNWKTNAGWSLQMQKLGCIVGRYSIAIDICEAEVGANSDLANREKAISDLLVAYGIIEDDHLCRRLVMEWTDKYSGAHVIVEKWK